MVIARLFALAVLLAAALPAVGQSPLFHEAVPEGTRWRVSFSHAQGLRTLDGLSVRGFSLAGEDRQFVPAMAVIDGEEVVVGAQAVPQPLAVRYNFADDADANLCNGALLPVAPFRTDAWELAARPANRAAFGALRTSFETEQPGELQQLVTPLGTFTASAGHAAITTKFAKSGQQALHLLGGTDRTVVLRLLGNREQARCLEFVAERWTARSPYAFAVQGKCRGQWTELYRGDEELRVGARFLSRVSVQVPAQTEELRLVSTAPEGAGTLLDDLCLTPAQPQRVVDVGHAAWMSPALLGRRVNAVAHVELLVTGNQQPQSLVACTLELLPETALEHVAAVALLWSGSAALSAATEQARVARAAFTPGQPLRVLLPSLALQSGHNHLWLAVELSERVPLTAQVGLRCTAVQFGDGSRCVPSGQARPQRIGVQVRAPGQDGCHTTRIPGLATSNAGTLLAVYDNRYRNAGDLPGDIDVGLSRSTDGGDTWSPMRVIMDMGNDPAFGHDGIGDPAILVDRTKGTIWVAAVWSHGNRSWHGSGPGLDPTQTGQLMLCRSDDDGLTWSQPMNITQQVKDPAWRLLLQGPGRGITLRDGTLVFAAQFRSNDASEGAGRPYATLLWSLDHGATWQVGTGARVDTTEAQVVELDDGSLLLNCRDNRGGSRAILTTRDLGKTWQDHATSRAALPEPICMASLLRIDSKAHGPLLLFSNPAATNGRRDLTLKLSRDQGRTWPLAQHWLYDQATGYGYSCLTPIGDDAVGVLYEGRGGLAFLRFALADLLR